MEPLDEAAALPGVPQAELPKIDTHLAENQAPVLASDDRYDFPCSTSGGAYIVTWRLRQRDFDQLDQKNLTGDGCSAAPHRTEALWFKFSLFRRTLERQRNTATLETCSRHQAMNTTLRWVLRFTIDDSSVARS